MNNAAEGGAASGSPDAPLDPARGSEAEGPEAMTTPERTGPVLDPKRPWGNDASSDIADRPGSGAAGAPWAPSADTPQRTFERRSLPVASNQERVLQAIVDESEDHGVFAFDITPNPMARLRRAMRRGGGKKQTFEPAEPASPPALQPRLNLGSSAPEQAPRPPQAPAPPAPPVPPAQPPFPAQNPGPWTSSGELPPFTPPPVPDFTPRSADSYAGPGFPPPVVAPPVSPPPVVPPPVVPPPLVDLRPNPAAPGYPSTGYSDSAVSDPGYAAPTVPQPPYAAAPLQPPAEPRWSQPAKGSSTGYVSAQPAGPQAPGYSYAAAAEFSPWAAPPVPSEDDEHKGRRLFRRGDDVPISGARDDSGVISANVDMSSAVAPGTTTELPPGPDGDRFDPAPLIGSDVAPPAAPLATEDVLVDEPHRRRIFRRGHGEDEYGPPDSPYVEEPDADGAPVPIQTGFVPHEPLAPPSAPASVFRPPAVGDAAAPSPDPAQAPAPPLPKLSDALRLSDRLAEVERRAEQLAQRLEASTRAAEARYLDMITSHESTRPREQADEPVEAEPVASAPVAEPEVEQADDAFSIDSSAEAPAAVVDDPAESLAPFRPWDDESAGRQSEAELPRSATQPDTAPPPSKGATRPEGEPEPDSPEAEVGIDSSIARIPTEQHPEAIEHLPDDLAHSDDSAPAAVDIDDVSVDEFDDAEFTSPDPQIDHGAISGAEPEIAPADDAKPARARRREARRAAVPQPRHLAAPGTTGSIPIIDAPLAADPEPLSTLTPADAPAAPTSEEPPTDQPAEGGDQPSGRLRRALNWVLTPEEEAAERAATEQSGGAPAAPDAASPRTESTPAAPTTGAGADLIRRLSAIDTGPPVIDDEPVKRRLFGRRRHRDDEVAGEAATSESAVVEMPKPTIQWDAVAAEKAANRSRRMEVTLPRLPDQETSNDDAEPAEVGAVDDADLTAPGTEAHEPDAVAAAAEPDAEAEPEPEPKPDTEAEPETDAAPGSVAIDTGTDTDGSAPVAGSELAQDPDPVVGTSAEPPAGDVPAEEPVRRRPKPFPRAEASTSSESITTSQAMITAAGPMVTSEESADPSDAAGFREHSVHVTTLTKPITTDKDGRRVESAEPDFVTAPKVQKAQRTKKPKTASTGSSGPWRLVIMVVLAVLAAFALRAYVVAPYYIPSSSMEKTLHGCSGCNNDHVLVDKLSYHLHSVHRGDIVVFNRPASWASVHDKVLIKRVIGLPGDVLSVSGGKLFVNGQLLDEPYLDKNCPPMTSLAALGAPTLLQAAKVPPGDLFVMGDNRCQSDDSRTNGPIPRKSVIGRAFVIIWPLGRIHYL